MKYIPIHSVGSCVHNHDLPREYDTDRNLINFVRKYKFYLAMENSNCKDYVTEKLYRTMTAGVVPIVDGPS